MKGMTRQELLEDIKCEDTGYFSDVLTDLCNCDFIRRYTAFGKTERNMMYQLTDLYTLYFLRFVPSSAMSALSMIIQGTGSYSSSS